jgi:hypothetical protein
MVMNEQQYEAERKALELKRREAHTAFRNEDFLDAKLLQLKRVKDIDEQIRQMKLNYYELVTEPNDPVAG